MQSLAVRHSGYHEVCNSIQYQNYPVPQIASAPDSIVTQYSCFLVACSSSHFVVYICLRAHYVRYLESLLFNTLLTHIVAIQHAVHELVSLSYQTHRRFLTTWLNSQCSTWDLSAVSLHVAPSAYLVSFHRACSTLTVSLCHCVHVYALSAYCYTISFTVCLCHLILTNYLYLMSPGIHKFMYTPQTVVHPMHFCTTQDWYSLLCSTRLLVHQRINANGFLLPNDLFT